MIELTPGEFLMSRQIPVATLVEGEELTTLLKDYYNERQMMERINEQNEMP